MKKQHIFLLLIFVLFIGSFWINETTLLSFLIQDTKETDINGYTKDNLIGLTPSYDVDQVDYANFNTFIKASKEVNKIASKGRVVIPSVDINLKIYEGINETHIAVGAGEQKPRSEVVAGGVGNYILASHNYYSMPGKLFSYLKYVKLDEKIYITDENNLYIYKVFNVDKPYMTDSILLNLDYGNRKIVTLYTCSGAIGFAPYRHVVQGELESTIPLDNLTLEQEKILLNTN